MRLLLKHFSIKIITASRRSKDQKPNQSKQSFWTKVNFLWNIFLPRAWLVIQSKFPISKQLKTLFFNNFHRMFPFFSKSFNQKRWDETLKYIFRRKSRKLSDFSNLKAGIKETFFQTIWIFITKDVRKHQVCAETLPSNNDEKKLCEELSFKFSTFFHQLCETELPWN